MTKKEWRLKFSQKVLSKMKRLEINQRELSRLSQIPENTLSRYLNATRTPQADVIVNLAKALQCSVNELIQFGEMVTH